MRVLDVSVQLLLLHHVEVHDIANIQVEYPVLRVLDTESIPHIQLESLVFLDVDEFF